MIEYTQSQREQAARVLEKKVKRAMLTDSVDEEWIDALDTAIACLRSPIASPEMDGKAGGWVRTSERMPTEEDEVKDDKDNEYETPYVFAVMMNENGSRMIVGMPAQVVADNPKGYPWWRKGFELPEVEHEAR